MKKQTKVFATLSAAALLAVGVSAVSMAAGWDNSTGVWRYLDNNGDAVTDEWKSANGNWFYLDSDGVMATNQLIEDNNNNKTRYYYVDQYGAMVTNTWKAVAMDDYESGDLDAEYWWMYFGNDGKAYTTEDNLSTNKIKTINGLKYAFDAEGHMLYGWIAKDNLEQQDNDTEAWKTSQYYFNGWNDGHMQTGWIQLSVDDNGDTENYWFWFKGDGQKQMKRKKINGSYYHFDGDDGHMLTDWANSTQSVEDAGGWDSASVSYLNGDGSERKNTWVWAVTDEHTNNTDLQKDYDDDEYRWWYFNKSGKLVKSQIKKINGKKYAFDTYGRMKVGFVQAGTDTVWSVKKPADWTRAQIIKGYNDVEKVSMDATSESIGLYFFSNDEEHDGSMKKGYQNLELDDGTCQFYFNTGNGRAATGYVSKIKKYCINGLVLAPTADDESNYGGVVIEGDNKPTDLIFTDKIGEAVKNGETVKMVNRSGSIVKSKGKLKDNNDAYYVVNSDGIVVGYKPDEDSYNAAVTYYVVASDGTKTEKKISITSGMLSATSPADLDSKIDAAITEAGGTGRKAKFEVTK